MLDSAQNRLEGPQMSQGDVYLGEGYIDVPPVQNDHSDGNLKSRKFILTMTLILISSLFTGMRMMDMDMWMFFVGGLAATYLGVNVYQKKMML